MYHQLLNRPVPVAFLSCRFAKGLGNKFLAALASVSLLASPALGQTTGSPAAAPELTVPPEPTPTPLPQRGLLSKSSTFGYNTKLVESTWGSEDSGKNEAPIAGSVSKRSDREWVARLYNNSNDVYSVSVEVRQLNAQGKRERSDSFSARIEPQGSYERSLSSTARTVDAELELRSWKNLSAK
jgi:hypothetical protein